MDDAAFDRLAPISYLQHFPAGVHLISEGDSADFLHVVVEGSVELYATGNGRETIEDPVALRKLARPSPLIDTPEEW
ncbi:MAG: cyclic nucleotide-binding domain-containing protein [Alphaproteobacteria bacterium]